MKYQVVSVSILLSLVSCTEFSFSDLGLISTQLFDARQMIINCEFERAIDLNQRYTVIGSTSEKRQAFENLNIIYLEKGDVNAYDYNLARFMFTVRDRNYSKAELIEQSQQDRQEVVTKREAQLGFSKC